MAYRCWACHSLPISTWYYRFLIHAIWLLFIQLSRCVSSLQNVRKVVNLGVAEAIDYANVTVAEVRSKLMKVLLEPKYAINSKQLSQHFRDQKEAPIERAVWWIEWAVRNPRGEFLMVPTLKLGHIVSNAFDVVAFLVITASLLLLIAVKLASHAVGAILPSTKSMLLLTHSRWGPRREHNRSRFCNLHSD